MSSVDIVVAAGYRRERMRKDLMLKLADLLDTVDPELFYYRDWFKGGPGESVGACGTRACALGWATTMPECGLAIVGLGYHLVGKVILANDANIHGTRAAMVAFDLDEDTAGKLFIPLLWNGSPPNDASPKDVAAWIRKVVSEAP